MSLSSKYGFGTYRLRGNDACASTIHAIQIGYEWIDTAPLYGNQDYVGNGILRCGRARNTFKITSKISRDALLNNSETSIIDAFFKTLRIMNIDYVDELILHEPIDPINNWKKLHRLFCQEASGLIGKIGVSNFNQNVLEDIINKTGIIPSVNQIEINPFLTRGDFPLFCLNKGIEVVAHSPLAKGELLTNEKLNIMATRYNVSCAQLMLKWGIQNGFRVIPRSKNLNHIEENISLQFEINQNDIYELNNLNCNYATHPKYLK